MLASLNTRLTKETIKVNVASPSQQNVRLYTELEMRLITPYFMCVGRFVHCETSRHNEKRNKKYVVF